MDHPQHKNSILLKCQIVGDMKRASSLGLLLTGVFLSGIAVWQPWHPLVDSADPLVYHWGSAEESQRLSHTFSVASPFDRSVAIVESITSCSCSGLEYRNPYPDQEGYWEITMMIDLSGISGPYGAKSRMVLSNGESFDVEMMGDVIP